MCVYIYVYIYTHIHTLAPLKIVFGSTTRGEGIVKGEKKKKKKKKEWEGGGKNGKCKIGKIIIIHF